MFGGGQLVGTAPNHPVLPAEQQPQQVSLLEIKKNTIVRIVEQPASKSLRFRYECEGRSAGSIPGVHSTPENKTYPSIEIVGYKGRAVVVVSCVTKDPPYKPHPHNLVGKDGCKKGVCTVEINPETMFVSFSNLGIQCVKRKDLEEALRVREEIRVDPFRTGFSHRNQPTSIDLNAVRLCFQVFLEGELKGRFTLPLGPVVSDVIYDKKAMSDLVICKMSHCTATVAGGKEVILLCEKVAKEDISIRFYEEVDSQLEWEAWGDFQHANVHKQVAISFRTPRYKTLEVDQPVKVFIQLRRPSDGSTSEALPFELLPLDSGRPGFLRRRNKELSILNKMLAEEALKSNNKINVTNEIDGNNNNDDPYPVIILQSPSSKADDDDNCINFVNNDQSTSVTTDSIVASMTESLPNGVADDLNESLMFNRSLDNSDTLNGNITEEVGNTEKSLNELLDQVAELDEIYSENQTRLETLANLDNGQGIDIDIDDFDDSNTYTSLQLAFKNPVPIAEPEEPFSYEDIMTVRGPFVELMPLKRETEEEKLPPLPPKRIRKTPSVEVIKPIAAVVPLGSAENVTKPGKTPPSSRSPSQSRRALSTPTDRPLPPTPSKKRSFLARIFQRKPKKENPRSGPEAKPPKSGPVGRSVSSVSGQRPSKFRQAVSHASLKDSTGNLSLGASMRYADSITHISLHGDEGTPSPGSLKRPASLAPLPPAGNDTILVAENVLAIDASSLRKLQDNLDLTEAEHYALYMALAPRATASEFDETSCYYSPVEGGKFLLSNSEQKS